MKSKLVSSFGAKFAHSPPRHYSIRNRVRTHYSQRREVWKAILFALVVCFVGIYLINKYF